MKTQLGKKILLLLNSFLNTDSFASFFRLPLNFWQLYCFTQKCYLSFSLEFGGQYLAHFAALMLITSSGASPPPVTPHT